MWEVPSEYQETHFQCESDQALAQLAQGYCADTILTEIQKLFQHDLGQQALSDPAWAGEMD